MGKILLLDGETAYQKAFLQAAAPDAWVEAGSNGQQALEQMEECSPDVLVLDLHLSDVDGTWVLRRAAREQRLPITIVTGDFFSTSLRSLLAQYGVAAIVHKPYRPDCLMELVEDLRKATPAVEPCQADWISDTLISLGILTSQKGFRYLHDGVEEKLRDSSVQMTKCLYPTIAKRYEITTTAVEKAMRTAIQAAYRRRNCGQWRRFFPTDQTGDIPQPTNGYFLTRLAESCPRKPESK